MSKLMESVDNTGAIIEVSSSNVSGSKSEEKKTEFFIGETETYLSLSKKHIFSEDNILLPAFLTHLDLSHNNLTVVPEAVLSLKNLKTLDLSFNYVEYFDATPNFCSTIECLNLSNNNLKGPPYWVWTMSPSNLIELDLSNNKQITACFKYQDGYFEEFLQFKCLVKDIKIYNCGIKQHFELISTFPEARNLKLGIFQFSYKSANDLSEFPSLGLEKCCYVENINLSNIQVFSLHKNIELFQHLIVLDLSQNKLRGLPKEFCNLKNLEVCILSYNYLLYLPDDLNQLTKLQCLKLDNNELCMLPDKLDLNISTLKMLDLYGNGLYEVSEAIYEIDEIDVAQNYFDEPECNRYLGKRDKLRLKESERVSGRKPEPEQPEYDHSPETSDDESYMQSLVNSDNHECDAMSSSSEDWDSDDYWVPHNYERTTASTKESWLCFVKRKMAEGNFCPMDAHATSVAELVKYEKLCNPPVCYESEGQFDDLSDNDS